MPASLDDILTAIKGATQNFSNLTIAFGSPGRTSQSFTTSPVASYFNSIASAAFGTQPFQVVAFNANRRAISFHSCDPMGNTTMWLTTNTTFAGAGVPQGIALVPGMNWVIDANSGSNAAWFAIAGSGTTNKLLVLEYV